MRADILEIKSDSLSYLIEDRYGHNVWTRVRFSSGPLKSSDGGMGRHEGLKIPWPVMAVRVQVPLGVPKRGYVEE